MIRVQRQEGGEPAQFAAVDRIKASLKGSSATT